MLASLLQADTTRKTPNPRLSPAPKSNSGSADSLGTSGRPPRTSSMLRGSWTGSRPCGSAVPKTTSSTAASLAPNTASTAHAASLISGMTAGPLQVNGHHGRHRPPADRKYLRPAGPARSRAARCGRTTRTDPAAARTAPTAAAPPGRPAPGRSPRRRSRRRRPGRRPRRRAGSRPRPAGRRSRLAKTVTEALCARRPAARKSAFPAVRSASSGSTYRRWSNSPSRNFSASSRRTDWSSRSAGS